MVAASAARRATRLATTKHTGIGHGQKQLHTATMNNFPSGSSPRSSPKHLGPVERLVRRFKGGAGHCDHDWSPDRLDSAEGKPGRRIESVDLDARFGALRLERDASSSFAPHYTHHRPHPSYRFSNSTSSPALSSTPPSHGSPAYRLDAPIHGATNSRREAAATRQYHQANGAPEHAKKYLTPWKQDTSSPWRPWTANKPLPLLLPYGRGDVLPPMPTPTPMFVDEPPKASPPPAAHARRPQSTFLPGSARVPLSKEAADVRFAEQQNQRTQETSVRRDPHLRAVSEPPPIRESPARRKEDLVSDPNHPPGLRQCWGIKRDGTRCMRKVGTAAAKSPLKGRQDVARSATSSPSKSVHRRGEAIVISDSESETAGRNSSDDEDIRRDYCHQHAREINKTEGFVLPGRRGSRLPRTSSVSSVSTAAADGRYVDFAPYLRTVSGNTGEEACKARLRAAMSRAPSDIDWRERGYLYIYELRDRSTSTHIALKVGRAVNVYKRFEQWRSQCQSKNPLLRAFFPRPEGAAQEVLPGASAAAEQGVVLSHKWERLCHIELCTVGKRLDDKCADCGSRHREIFLIPRGSKAGYESVRAIVEKWLDFVRLLARDGGVAK